MAEAARRRRPWLPWLPVAVGAVVAVGLAAFGPATALRFTVRPAGAAVSLGVVLTAAWLLVAGARSRRDGAVAAAARAADEQARAGARADHDRFVDRLDHELKNPVTAIRAALAAHPEAGSGHLRTADEQAARLGVVVGDLRRLAELRSCALELAAVDLPTLLEDAVATVRGELAARGERRELRTQFPEAPWQLPPVVGDSDLLFLAVHNVLANACKFTDDGGLVEVRAAEGDGWVDVDVADTGRGIAGDELELVLEELARGSNARGVPGSGLGLSMVRTVLERHAGSVTVRSRLGEGTNVRLRLPLGRATDRGREAAAR